jgi:trimeric autotransporter adhesin
MRQLSLAVVSILTTLLFVQEANSQFSNTNYGSGALQFNTTGYNNSAFGYVALNSNTNGTGNSAFGSSALRDNTTGGSNTGIGSDALRVNTIGSRNVAIGAGALLLNTTGSYNTASGSGALSSNKTGSYNTASGYAALAVNSTGTFNSAFGVNSLLKNGSGYNNTAFGAYALNANTTGRYNTACGTQALQLNTTGSNNTASGSFALYSNSTGFNNTAVGNYALRNNTTGARNTAIGDSAGAVYSYNYSTFVGYKTTTSVSGLTNVTVIGYGASAMASNQVRIGNTSVTSIGGKVSWSTLSDGRFKKNIQEDVPGLAFITKLRPVTYTLDIAALEKASGITEQSAPEEVTAKAAAAKEKHTGFVAQEVEKAATELNYNFGGVDKPKNDKDFYGLRYAEFVVPLVKAVQELDEKSQRVDALEKEVAELKAMVTRLANGQVVNLSTLTSSYLEQNTPNPVSGSTLIRYSIPSSIVSATLNITNAKGQVVKTLTLSNRGVGQVSLNTQALASGTYNYTLYVDGKQIDTKRLVVAR